MTAGLAAAALITLGTVELFASVAVDMLQPWRVVSLFDSPPRFFASVGAKILLGIAVGLFAAVTRTDVLRAALNQIDAWLGEDDLVTANL